MHSHRAPVWLRPPHIEFHLFSNWFFSSPPLWKVEMSPPQKNQLIQSLSWPVPFSHLLFDISSFQWTSGGQQVYYKLITVRRYWFKTVFEMMTVKLTSLSGSIDCASACDWSIWEQRMNYFSTGGREGTRHRSHDRTPFLLLSHLSVRSHDTLKLKYTRHKKKLSKQKVNPVRSKFSFTIKLNVDINHLRDVDHLNVKFECEA